MSKSRPALILCVLLLATAIGVVVTWAATTPSAPTARGPSGRGRRVRMPLHHLLPVLPGPIDGFDGGSHPAWHGPMVAIMVNGRPMLIRGYRRYMRYSAMGAGDVNVTVFDEGDVDPIFVAAVTQAGRRSGLAPSLYLPPGIDRSGFMSHPAPPQTASVHATEKEFIGSWPMTPGNPNRYRYRAISLGGEGEFSGLINVNSGVGLIRGMGDGPAFIHDDFLSLASIAPSSMSRVYGTSMPFDAGHHDGAPWAQHVTRAARRVLRPGGIIQLHATNGGDWSSALQAAGFENVHTERLAGTIMMGYRSMVGQATFHVGQAPGQE